MNQQTISQLGRTVLALAFTAALGNVARAESGELPPAATKANVTYAGDIKAIFDTSCVKCHGDEKPKAGLKLTSLAGVLKGSKEGKVIKPGKSADSGLVLSVAYATKDEDMWMPPKNNKAKIAPLTKEQVGLIRAWIDQGAK